MRARQAKKIIELEERTDQPLRWSWDTYVAAQLREGKRYRRLDPWHRFLETQPDKAELGMGLEFDEVWSRFYAAGGHWDGPKRLRGPGDNRVSPPG